MVGADEKKVCRAKRNSCDLEEVCPGGSSACPRDSFTYPGTPCKSSGGYDGLCFAGECGSLEETCTVDMQRDFGEGRGMTIDLTPTCAAYNDNCGNLVCHNGAPGKKYYDCYQGFVVHNKNQRVP